MNPAEWLVRAARRWPRAPALLKGSHAEADYAAFAARAAAIGAALRNRFAVKPGDRVALFMTNRTEYLEALYGAWFAGAVAVPINAKLHPKEAAWILEHAEAEIVLVSEDVGDPLRPLTPGCVREMISVDRPEFAAMRAVEPMGAPVAQTAADTAWLFYTSGTTGRPKGVMISSANIQAMAWSYFLDVDPATQSDAILYAAPMSHGAGLYNFIHVLCGAPHVVGESGGFNPAEILGLGREIVGLSLFAAPTMVRRLVAHAKHAGGDGTGLKTIIYGGGPMYGADILEAVEVMGPRFVQIYGQGECPMAISALGRDLVADREHPRWRERLASAGRAQSCSQIRIVDDEMRPLATGEIGEIAVSGLAVAPGYWRDAAATAAAIRDGWLRTGDVGALDGEGFLTLHDRSKDVIISGGSNIYPREIEEVLLTHPEVAEASVVGRPHPDWGEEVVAFLALTPGATLDPTDLDRLCAENIARFKRPKAYRFQPQLPKNNYGKILKTKLRQALKAEE